MVLNRGKVGLEAANVSEMNIERARRRCRSSADKGESLDSR